MALAAFAATAPALAGDAPLKAFAQVRPGLWTLRSLDGSGGNLSVCLTSPAQFIQLRHRGQRCQTLVLENGADRTTVQYRCRGTGYGRTSVAVENPNLLTIDTQGLANGAPFDVSYEARQQGACPAR